MKTITANGLSFTRNEDDTVTITEETKHRAAIPFDDLVQVLHDLGFISDTPDDGKTPDATEIKEGA